LDNLQYNIEDKTQRDLTFTTIPERWANIDYGGISACELQNNGASYYENDLFFYHGNHLSSTQMITDMSGYVIQEIHYAPFGEVISEYTPYWHGGKIPDYMFNGKELDEETGMYYYEARYYNPPMFISRDPLFEKYPNISPYAYCANNPLKYIDPTGMEIDDYFDLEGNYLGSDNAKTDNVRIIDRATWDANKMVNEDASESIHHKTGNIESVALSESDMNTQQQLSVYQHYNPTDLPLQASNDDPGNKWGMSFSRKEGKLSINIRLEGNKNNKVSDNANEIINLFSHEKQHYSDFKTMGANAFISWSENSREQSAIKTQMQHPSWGKTRPSFQSGMKRYGERYGMTF
jgi:RHS repeat-associated protein